MRIYRVSGLQSAGSASIVARAITSIQPGVKVSVDVAQGLVNVEGLESDRVSRDFLVASAVRHVGCDYLGVEGPASFD